MDTIDKRLSEFIAVTVGRMDVVGSRLLLYPWIYKVALGTWANRRERFYLQMFVGLN